MTVSFSTLHWRLPQLAIAISTIMCMSGCDLEQRSAWRAAQDEGTIAAIEQYIEAYPGGRYLDAAQQKIVDIAWQQVQDTPSLSAYTGFVESYTEDGSKIVAAKDAIEALLSNCELGEFTLPEVTITDDPPSRVVITPVEGEADLFRYSANEGAGYFITFSRITTQAAASYSGHGTEFILHGPLPFDGGKLVPDVNFPPVIKIIRDVGLAYVNGKMTVQYDDGASIEFGLGQTVDGLVSCLQHGELKRLAGAWGLGWLPQSAEEKMVAAEALLDALNDSSRAVQRTAAESLGRVAGIDTLSTILSAMHKFQVSHRQIQYDGADGVLPELLFESYLKIRNRNSYWDFNNAATNPRTDGFYRDTYSAYRFFHDGTVTSDTFSAFGDDVMSRLARQVQWEMMRSKGRYTATSDGVSMKMKSKEARTEQTARIGDGFIRVSGKRWRDGTEYSWQDQNFVFVPVSEGGQ